MDGEEITTEITTYSPHKMVGGGEEDIDLSGRGIKKMKRKEALMACQRLGLTVDGTVKDLQDRLREYLNNQEEPHICHSCGGIRPSFGKKINPMLLKYAQWDIDSTGSFLELNGALFTKPIKTRVKKTGTALGFTFPKALMSYLNLEAGDAVQLIIMPDKQRK